MPFLQSRPRARSLPPSAPFLELDAEPDAGESAEKRGSRLATALMVAFRDRPDEQRFERLHRFTEASVRRWIQLALGPHARRVDPSELVQDAFVNIYRYAGGFRDDHPESFRCWAQALCRNVVRRALMRPRGVRFLELPEGPREPADPRAEPWRQASEKEQRKCLSGAFGLLLMHYTRAYALLSPRDRLALRLIEVEGASYVEASERLGVRMSNMKMIIFRARRRILARMRSSMGLDESCSAALEAS